MMGMRRKTALAPIYTGSRGFRWGVPCDRVNRNMSEKEAKITEETDSNVKIVLSLN